MAKFVTAFKRFKKNHSFVSFVLFNGSVVVLVVSFQHAPRGRYFLCSAWLIMEPPSGSQTTDRRLRGEKFRLKQKKLSPAGKNLKRCRHNSAFQTLIMHDCCLREISQFVSNKRKWHDSGILFFRSLGLVWWRRDNKTIDLSVPY